MIAGQFRFNYCLKADFFEDQSTDWKDTNQVMSRWETFLNEELSRLFLRWYDLPRYIGTSAFFANPDPVGMAAEEEIYQITLAEYSNLNLEPETSNG